MPRIFPRPIGNESAGWPVNFRRRGRLSGFAATNEFGKRDQGELYFDYLCSFFSTGSRRNMACPTDSLPIRVTVA